MAHTISQTSTAITISGSYKAFTAGAGSTSTVIQYSSGEAPASSDAGRFLMWKHTAGQTGTWQIRYMESATATTVTVADDGFRSAPPSGASFVISTNLDDIVAAVSGATKTGTSYIFSGREWNLENGAFLADVNKSLDMTAHSTAGFQPHYKVAQGCAVQFGRLRGGEANGSFETTEGCRLSLESTGSSMALLGGYGTFVADGPIFNLYGCLVEAYGTDQFLRGGGPVRFIGCVFDGVLGGRWLSAATEVVQTRFSGNPNGGIAWSLGATFTRPISDALFYDNNTVCKAFQNFRGEFRNTTFTDSNQVIINSDGAQSSAKFDFIDCTTFSASDISSTNLHVTQAKSINYTITDADGNPLSGVKVAVYDRLGNVQGGGVQVSAADGTVPAIDAIFFDRPHQGSVSNNAPFDIRISRYGFVYQYFQSAVSEPIKQEIRLASNALLASTEAEAAAVTGISLNFATETVTITADHDTQSLYDYYQYQKDQTANKIYGLDLVRTGNSFDLDDWDMVVDGCDYEGDVTTTGTITLQNGATFTGTRTDANGTVLPLLNISITGITAGSRLQIYNVTTAAEVVNTTVAGTSYTATYAEGTGYSSGDTVRIRLTQVGTTTAKLPLEATVLASDAGWTALVSQEDDTVYNAFAVDGSTVTTFTADYVNDQVDVTVAADFNLSDFYSWWAYNLTTTQGIREFFGGLTAEDQANFRINTTVLSLFLDNTTNTEIIQLDNRRIYRSDLVYPVVRPSTGGGGLDVQWRDQILLAQGGSSGGLTAAQDAALSAIKAKTDNLPSDPLGEAQLATALDPVAKRSGLVVLNDGIKKIIKGFAPHNDNIPL